MVIEKILGEHEKLLAFSGVHGTTGYEWLNAITQVLVDGTGRSRSTKCGGRSATSRLGWRLS